MPRKIFTRGANLQMLIRRVKVEPLFHVRDKVKNQGLEIGRVAATKKGSYTSGYVCISEPSIGDEPARQRRCLPKLSHEGTDLIDKEAGCRGSITVGDTDPLSLELCGSHGR